MATSPHDDERPAGPHRTDGALVACAGRQVKLYSVTMGSRPAA